MKALIQRVKNAKVDVDGATVGQIEQGLLVFVGIDKADTDKQISWIANKLLGYRVFEDEQGRMNKSVQSIEGGVLLVSQFTLSADTNSGMRPSFSSAAEPLEAKRLFDLLVASMKEKYSKIETGEFGANMQVSLLNDGPVTFLLESPSQ